MDQIDILRGFMKSEQVGNWVMQVQTIKVMPPNLQGGGVGWGIIVQNIYVSISSSLNNGEFSLSCSDQIPCVQGETGT